MAILSIPNCYPLKLHKNGMNPSTVNHDSMRRTDDIQANIVVPFSCDFTTFFVPSKVLRRFTHPFFSTL